MKISLPWVMKNCTLGVCRLVTLKNNYTLEVVGKSIQKSPNNGIINTIFERCVIEAINRHSFLCT